MEITQVLGSAQDAMTVRRVYGEPYEKDGATIIPAAAVRGGGGGGGGGGTGADGERGEGEGGGFGLSARPVGAYVFKDGNAEWVPAVDVTRVAIIGNVVGLLLGVMLFRYLRYRTKRRT